MALKRECVAGKRLDEDEVIRDLAGKERVPEGGGLGWRLEPEERTHTSQASVAGLAVI